MLDESLYQSSNEKMHVVASLILYQNTLEYIFADCDITGIDIKKISDSMVFLRDQLKKIGVENMIKMSYLSCVGLNDQINKDFIQIDLYPNKSYNYTCFDNLPNIVKKLIKYPLLTITKTVIDGRRLYVNKQSLCNFARYLELFYDEFNEQQEGKIANNDNIFQKIQEEQKLQIELDAIIKANQEKKKIQETLISEMERNANKLLENKYIDDEIKVFTEKLAKLETLKKQQASYEEFKNRSNFSYFEMDK